MSIIDDDGDRAGATGYYIDGQEYTGNDLTFREQRKIRDFIRALAPDNDPEKASEADIMVAFVTAVKQRTDPAYTVDDAMDLKPSDLEAPPTKGAKKAA